MVHGRDAGGLGSEMALGRDDIDRSQNYLKVRIIGVGDYLDVAGGEV